MGNVGVQIAGLFFSPFSTTTGQGSSMSSVQAEGRTTPLWTHSQRAPSPSAEQSEPLCQGARLRPPARGARAPRAPTRGRRPENRPTESEMCPDFGPFPLAVSLPQALCPLLELPGWFFGPGALSRPSPGLPWRRLSLSGPGVVGDDPEPILSWRFHKGAVPKTALSGSPLCRQDRRSMHGRWRTDGAGQFPFT